MALFRYWNTSPPIHEAFARFVGIKASAPPVKQKDPAESDRATDELIAMLAGAGGFAIEKGVL